MVLKRNSKAILDVFAGQKKKNMTQAYKQIHQNASTATAIVNGSVLLNKPESQIYLQEHISKAQKTIVELTDSGKDDIRLRASQDILDRSHGKAIQQVIQSTSGITLLLDLRGGEFKVADKTD